MQSRRKTFKEPRSKSGTLYVWIEGGIDGLIAHRKRIADEGVAIS